MMAAVLAFGRDGRIGAMLHVFVSRQRDSSLPEILSTAVTFGPSQGDHPPYRRRTVWTTVEDGATG
jgi:hypothetical protein